MRGHTLRKTWLLLFQKLPNISNFSVRQDNHEFFPFFLECWQAWYHAWHHTCICKRGAPGMSRRGCFAPFFSEWKRLQFFSLLLAEWPLNPVEGCDIYYMGGWAFCSETFILCILISYLTHIMINTLTNLWLILISLYMISNLWWCQYLNFISSMILYFEYI